MVTAPSLPFASMSVTKNPFSLSILEIVVDLEGLKTRTTALPKPINISN